MRRAHKNSNFEVDNYDSHVTWKKRPSEIRGYLRTFYCNDNNDDYIRVDYNIREKKVRLYVESREEGGLEYYSIINNGKVTIERSLTTGRAANLYSKFSKRAKVFASIPNKQVLRLIGDNYDIPNQMKDSRKKIRDENLEITRRKYFVVQPRTRSNTLGDFSSSKSIRFVDFIDIAVGTALTYFTFKYSLSLIMTGIVAAIYGIMLGILDMFIRSREPIFFKIMIFIVAGFFAYLYGYYIY